MASPSHRTGCALPLRGWTREPARAISGSSTARVNCGSPTTPAGTAIQYGPPTATTWFYSSRRRGRWQIFSRSATAVGSKNCCSRSRPRSHLCSFCVPGRSSTRPTSQKTIRYLETRRPGVHAARTHRRGLSCDAQLSPTSGGSPTADPRRVATSEPGGLCQRALPCEGRAVAEGVIAALASGWGGTVLSGEGLHRRRHASRSRRTPSESSGDILFLGVGIRAHRVSGQVYDVTPDGQRFS